MNHYARCSTLITRQVRLLAVAASVLVLSAASAHGQAFNLYGCTDGAGCDTSPAADNVVLVTNLDIGQGFSLTGELTYYPLTSPGGSISTLLSPVAGVRLTDATITYSASNPGPVTGAEFDLIYFEYPVALGPGPYVTIASYTGAFNNTTAAGTRAFSLRTFTNGGLIDPDTVTLGTGVSSTTATGGPHAMQGSSAPRTNSYNPPLFGTESTTVIPTFTAYPGDFFTFPTSIEVGVFVVPEPSAFGLAFLSLLGLGTTRSRKR